MAIHLGKPVSDIYCGDSKINEMYLGAEKVYPNGKIVGYVTIGEHNYPYVKIGNLYWIAENLKEPFGNYSMWYNNDPTYEHSKLGLLYSPNAIQQGFSNLPDGWRLPLASDRENLMSVATPKQLLSTEMWPSDHAGTDDFGFNFLPSGAYNGGSYRLGEYGAFWSNNPSYTYPYDSKSPSNQYFRRTATYYWWYSVRLCKTI